MRVGQEVQEVPRSLTEAALEFVRTFNEGDLEAFGTLLDPDVEIHSMRGLKKGRDAAVAWATRAPGGVQQTIEVVGTDTAPGRVLLEVDRVWRWDEDGTHASTEEMAWLFEVGEDGLISAWRPFEDRSEAIRALGS